jgi:hypothetical protein
MDDDYFHFHSLRDAGENELDSNLTELNGGYSFFDRGYTRHPDWLAHVSRYIVVAEAAGHLVTRKHSGKVKVLDVGCGWCNLPIAMHHNRGLPEEYWGLDLRASPGWVKRMPNWTVPTHLVRADFVLDDMAAIPGWPKRGFDITCCFEAFEHVPRSRAQDLMNRLFEWTRPGALCYFSTPNAGVSKSIADNHVGPDGEEREWAYDDKMAVARKAGFAVEAEYGTFASLGNLPDFVADPQSAMGNSHLLAAAKAYLPHAWYVAMVAAAYPRESNNAIWFLRRPK